MTLTLDLWTSTEMIRKPGFCLSAIKVVSYGKINELSTEALCSWTWSSQIRGLAFTQTLR